MKKVSTICIVCLLAVLLLTPSSFGQGKYSYRFEKFLELIDYYYFQPNNLDREQIEKEKMYIIPHIMGNAFMHQRRVSGSRLNSLFKEFERSGDLWRYAETIAANKNCDPFDLVMAISSFTRDRYEQRNMDEMKRAFGEDFRTQGDRMRSFTEWEQKGYPPLEVPVTAVPMPPEIKKFWGKPDVGVDEPEKKAVELLGVEAESTEDLHFDGGFQKKTPDPNKKEPEMPDPSSAPDIDELQ